MALWTAHRVGPRLQQSLHKRRVAAIELPVQPLGVLQKLEIQAPVTQKRTPGNRTRTGPHGRTRCCERRPNNGPAPYLRRARPVAAAAVAAMAVPPLSLLSGRSRGVGVHWRRHRCGLRPGQHNSNEVGLGSSQQRVAHCAGVQVHDQTVRVLGPRRHRATALRCSAAWLHIRKGAGSSPRRPEFLLQTPSLSSTQMHLKLGSCSLPGNKHSRRGGRSRT